MSTTTRRPLLGTTERELGRQSVMNALARNGIIWCNQDGPVGDPYWVEPLVTAWHRGEESDMGIRSAVRIAWQDAQPAPGATYQGVRLQQFGRAAATAPGRARVNWRSVAFLAVLAVVNVAVWVAVGVAAHWLYGVVTR